MRRPASSTVVTGSSISSAPAKRPVGEARRLAPAIMVVDDRGDARRIRIALLGQHAVRPGRAGVDREARRPIAERLDPRSLGDGGMGSPEIGPEALLAQGEDPLMVPAVAGDLVARLGRPPDQRRVALGDPAQSEEGRLDPGLVEQVEHRLAVALDPPLEPVPARRGRSPSRRRRPGTSPRRRRKGRSAWEALPEPTSPSPAFCGRGGARCEAVGGEGLYS